MLKKRFLFVALSLTLWTAVAPAVAGARPVRAERASQWRIAASTFSLWWGILTGQPAARLTVRSEKNGCGIDPNGVPILCGIGIGGSVLEAEAEDGDSGGSGF